MPGEQPWAFSWGLGLRLEPRRGNEVRQRLTHCRASPNCGVCESMCEPVGVSLTHRGLPVRNFRLGALELHHRSERLYVALLIENWCKVPISSQPPAAATSIGGRFFRSVATESRRDRGAGG
jgi:hypothetical protein